MRGNQTSEKNKTKKTKQKNKKKKKKKKKPLPNAYHINFWPFLFVSKEVTDRYDRYSDNVNNAPVEPSCYYVKQNILNVKYVLAVFAVCQLLEIKPGYYANMI